MEVVWKSHVVLIGQVKQYFAYESQHQHGAIDMTGGLEDFFVEPSFVNRSPPVVVHPDGGLFRISGNPPQKKSEEFRFGS